MNCRHCGAADSLTSIVSETIESKRDDGGGTPYEWSRNLVVERCKQCGGFTLSTYDYGDWMDPSEVTYLVVYPEKRDLSPLPTRVQVELEKAQKVRNIDAGYYALGLRRTLEALCTENGIGKSANLVERLKKLASQENLPEVFVGMADYLRNLGNLGAHESDVEVTKTDIIAATEFTDAILEYLYIAPAKLDRVTKELAERKANAKSGNA